MCKGYSFAMNYVTFIMGLRKFRLISPAIVTPESCGVLPGDNIPSPQTRRNLVLLTKLLQVGHSVLHIETITYMSSIIMPSFLRGNELTSATSIKQSKSSEQSHE